MPTPKRERHKALQAAKRAQAEASRRKRRDRILGGGVAVVVVVAAGIVLAVLDQGGGKPKTGSPATTTTQAATATTATPVAEPCPPVGGAPSRVASFSEPPPNCLVAGAHYTAVVATDAGDFSIALDPSDPVVVNDFVYLARYKFYDGLVFQRVIPGFVVQGGDPNPLVSSQVQGPGYSVQGTVPKPGAYQVGTVAMAKTTTQADGTAGSQFFVVVGSAGVALPPQYSVLGQVTAGLSVVKEIEASGTASGNPTLYHYITSLTISTS